MTTSGEVLFDCLVQNNLLLADYLVSYYFLNNNTLFEITESSSKRAGELHSIVRYYIPGI